MRLHYALQMQFIHSLHFLERSALTIHERRLSNLHLSFLDTPPFSHLKIYLCRSRGTCPYLRFPAVQPGGCPQPGCLKDRGLRLMASEHARTACLRGSWRCLSLRHDASSLFCVVCNVRAPTCLPEVSQAVERSLLQPPWDATWASVPSMCTPCSMRVLCALMNTPSLQFSLHSAYFYSKCTHLWLPLSP